MKVDYVMESESITYGFMYIQIICVSSSWAIIFNLKFIFKRKRNVVLLDKEIRDFGQMNGPRKWNLMAQIVRQLPNAISHHFYLNFILLLLWLKKKKTNNNNILSILRYSKKEKKLWILIPKWQENLSQYTFKTRWQWYDS